MARRVVIDADECIGCESCVELCAEVFAFNEAEEKAEVIMPEGKRNIPLIYGVSASCKRNMFTRSNGSWCWLG
jgi:Fe-S-cluster-containing dehydrogenase component